MSANTNRTKGHNFERELRKKLIEIGFDKCQTSRYASKMMDDMKVDLVGTEPFYIQAKNTKVQPNFKSVLNEMPKTENYNVVAHKTTNKGSTVTMWLDDFLEIVAMLKNEKIL